MSTLSTRAFLSPDNLLYLKPKYFFGFFEKNSKSQG
jgi:hypothetical protein